MSRLKRYRALFVNGDLVTERINVIDVQPRAIHLLDAQLKGTHFLHFLPITRKRFPGTE